MREVAFAPSSNRTSLISWHEQRALTDNVALGHLAEMWKQRSIAFCAWFLVICTGAAAEVVQDQVQSEFGIWAHLRPNSMKFELAQTFQPGVEGRLIRMSHEGISPGGMPEYPTIIEITDTVEGMPGMAVLGHVVVTNLSNQQIVEFDDDEIYLETNRTYTIRFRTDAPAGTVFVEYGFRSAYSTGDAYERGALWSRPPGGEWSVARNPISPTRNLDLAFATFMEPGIPDIRIDEPRNGAKVDVGDQVQLLAVLSPGITEVSEVVFRAGEEVIGTVSSAPYLVTWIPEAAGMVDVVAVLQSSEGPGIFSTARRFDVTQGRPANDDFADRILVTEGVYSSAINQENATVERGEPRPFSESAGKSVWWEYTPVRTTWATFVASPSAGSDSLLSLFAGTQVDALYRFASGTSSVVHMVDPFTHYQVGVDTAFAPLAQTFLSIVLNDVEITAPTSGEVYWAPAEFTLRIVRTAEERTLVSVEAVADEHSLGLVDQGIGERTCTLVNSGYYSLRLKATDEDGIDTYSHFVPIVVRPANDDFEAAEWLVGRHVELETSNRAGTLEGRRIYPWTPGPGEPTWAGNNGGASIWYQWTAPADGLCVLEATSEEGFSVLFNVCQGTAVTNLTVTASNAQQPLHAPAEFDAKANTTYFISVDGRYGEEGVIKWNLHLHPYNDQFLASRLLSGLSLQFVDSLAGATVEPEELNLLPPGATTSLWYQWQAPFAGTVSVAIAADVPLALGIFDGDSLSSLVLVAESPEDSSNPVQVDFAAEEGKVYRIVVIGQGLGEGSFSFALTWLGLRLLSPQPNTIVPATATVPLEVALGISGKSLAEVVFKANGSIIATVTNPPFAMRWSGMEAGTYVLTAEGTAVDATVYSSPSVACLVYSGDHFPQPRAYSAPSSDTSYVVNGVGALHLFGKLPEQFGRTADVPGSVPFPGIFPSGVTSWKEITASWNTAWAIDGSGRLYRDGQTLVPFPSGVTGWKQVSGGYSGMIAIGDDGDLYLDAATRINVPRPTGGWRQARASLHSVVHELVLGLGENGEAYQITYYNGWSSSLLTRPGGVSRWKSADLAGLFGVLLAEDDNLWIYGFYGGVTGTFGTPGYSPVSKPPGVDRWVAFDAGGYHVLAIGNDGQLYAWGRNWEHQLGISADQNPRESPVKVELPPGVRSWSSVAAGRFHSLAIADDCRIYSWGANDYGQLGHPVSLPLSKPTHVGSLQALCGTPVIFTDGAASRLPDGTFRLQFSSDLNRNYLIQYSDDLDYWKTADTLLLGTGQLVEWIDRGPPDTDLHPAVVGSRSYRVIYAP